MLVAWLLAADTDVSLSTTERWNMSENYYNSSLTGENIEATLLGAVRGDATQNKGDTWKAKARQNIGAVSLAEAEEGLNLGTAAVADIDSTLAVSGDAADAKATGDAIGELKSNTATLKYSNATVIPANSDLNDYIVPGNYRVTTVNSRTLANAPEQSGARIFVLTRLGTTTFNQIWLSEQSLYVRGYTSGTWQAWRNATQLTDATLTEPGVPADSKTVGTNSLITRTFLSSGDDCNNLNIGAYFKDGNVEVLNGVDSSMAVVVCFTPDSRPYGKVQLWINCGYKKIYFRAAGARSGGSTRWSDWKQLATMSDIVSIDDTLSISGEAADAAKVGEHLNKADIYDGFIFRLSENPDPIPVGASHISYAQLISMWDSLMDDVNYLAEKTYHQGNNFEDTVTKTKVGESTTTDSITTGYDIFQYVFEPRNPEFTVFLTSGCDGDEYEAYWSLYRFMRTLYFEGYKYPNLRNLRHRVRFVCVPAYNPWGVDNGVRNCPLGFQTLANLNQSVTVGSTTYPAFTSKECQAIRDCLDGLQESYGTINLWVDIHTDPYSVTHDWKKGFYGYAPTGSPINKVLYGLTIDFDNLIKAETGSDTDFTIYNSSAGSTSGMPGYGTGRGIPTALIETTIGEFYDAVGSTSRIVSGSAQTMKYAQEWYWNVIANMICAL